MANAEGGDGDRNGYDAVRVEFSDNRHERIARRRGWDDLDIIDVIRNPTETKPSTDLRTGDPATVYYRKDGHYVMRNNVTGEIFHVSNTHDPGWIDPLDNAPIRTRP